jgi:hypothetical protein
MWLLWTLSWWRLRSTFLWKLLSHCAHVKGLKLVCFLWCVILRMENKREKKSLNLLLKQKKTNFFCDLQIWALWEAFEAVWALIWLFSCKNRQTKMVVNVFGEMKQHYSPVCVYVCFFISDFWWNLLPQWLKGHSNGRTLLHTHDTRYCTNI